MTVTLAQMISTARDAGREIAPADAREAINRGEIDLVVDVREPDEFRDKHVAKSVNIPRGWLEIRADPASPGSDAALTGARSGRVVVYCTKGPGARSLLAAQTLRTMGYEHVEVLGGGLVAWAQAGFPVESEHQAATA